LLDVDALRRDTPGCKEVTHLNNAGAALMPQSVIDAQVDHVRREARVGGYEAKAEMAPAIAAVYDSIAALINAKAADIALTDSATSAWNRAFQAFAFKPGDRIVTCEAEYASNYLNYLRARELHGVEILVAPSDGSGQIDLDAMETLLDERVKLIAITHVPTNGGLVNPAAAVGQLARRFEIPFLLDACQSVGQLKIDVEAIGCDLLSATGRKFLRGPRGTGFLYVRPSLLAKLQPQSIDLHSATWTAPDRYDWQEGARRFELWEMNYAAVLGLGAAVDYLLALDMEVVEARIGWLARRLRYILAEDVRVPVHDIGETQCGIVTFSVHDRSAEELVADLAAHRVNLSVSDRNGTLLDFERRSLPHMARASVHYYNNEEDDFAQLTYAMKQTRRYDRD